MNPALISSAIMAGGSVLGAGMQYFGAKQANEMGQASADKQMQWSERLSSTARQRDVADLKAAGLNPMLALGAAGGSSTPGGSTYNPRSETQEAAATAAQYASIMAELGKTRAETAFIGQQAKNAGFKGDVMQLESLPYRTINNALSSGYNMFFKRSPW